MLPEFTREELAAGLDAIVKQILATAGVQEPPVDAFAVAARLGIAVATDDLQQGRARYVRLHGRRASRTQSAILLRSDVRPERRHWAVAHEIGEHAAHRVFARWGVDPAEAASQAREEVANCLAGRLLLPTDWFMADGTSVGWDVPGLKLRYATASNELIVRRMLECPPPVIVTIVDQEEVYFRRSNVPGRVPPLSPAEKECWKTVHTENRPERIYEGLLKIQGWPIHEPEWRREILRVEVAELADTEPAGGG